MSAIPKQDEQIRLELAREAKDILDNRAFLAAVGVLKHQWEGELLSDATVDPNKIFELRAKLMALNAIPQLLRNLMTPQMRGADVRQFTGSGP